MVNLVALKAEIQNDPLGLGYAPFVQAGADQGLAEALNQIRGSISIRRSDVQASEVASAISVADYTTLPANPSNAQLSTERRYLSWLSAILSVPTIRLLNDDGSDSPVIANFKAMFAANTGTLQRLQSIATRTGSRAEQLFGAGVIVRHEEVHAALQLP